MSQELVRKQFVISLRNGMVAYILADKIEDITGALQNNKFFNTKEEMLINTADIVAIMSPSEWSDQQKYQRGWYKSHRGTKWFNKRGEYEEETELGMYKNGAERRASDVLKIEDAKERKLEAVKLLLKAKEKGVHDLMQYETNYNLIEKEYGENLPKYLTE